MSQRCGKCGASRWSRAGPPHHKCLEGTARRCLCIDWGFVNFGGSGVRSGTAVQRLPAAQGMVSAAAVCDACDSYVV